MSSPVSETDLLFPSNTQDLCEVLRAYLQSVSVLRAFLDYTVDEDKNNQLNLEFLQDIVRWQPAMYAIATNTGNAYKATLPIPFEALTELTGRPFVLKIPAENTGSSTLNISTETVVGAVTTTHEFGPITINKHGGVALTGKELKAEKLAIFCYNGSTFHLLNPDLLSPAEALRRTEPQALPGIGETVEIARPEGALMYSGYMICKQNDEGLANSGVDMGYLEGDEVDMRYCFSDTGNAAHVPGFTITTREGTWVVTQAVSMAAGGGLLRFHSQNGGPFTDIHPERWKFQIAYYL